MEQRIDSKVPLLLCLYGVSYTVMKISTQLATRTLWHIEYFVEKSFSRDGRHSELTFFQ